MAVQRITANARPDQRHQRQPLTQTQLARQTGFVEQFGLTYTIPLDSEFAASGRYNIRGMPTTFFIDAGGTIRSVYVGEMTSMTLAENIAGLLR